MPPTLSRIVRIASSYTKRLFTQSEDAEIRRTIDTLEEVVLLDNLGWHNRRDLAHAVHERTFRADETIYYQGDPGLGLYIVEKGTVELFIETENDRERICLVHPGEPFGVYSLLGEFSRLETARAQTDTRLLGFFRPDFRTLAKRHPRTGLLILTGIAQELAARQTELVEHQVSTDRSRVALLRAMYEVSVESTAFRPSSLIN